MTQFRTLATMRETLLPKLINGVRERGKFLVTQV